MARPALLLVVALVATAFGTPAQAASPHVVGGTATTSTYPFQAQVNVATGERSSSLCGGTLVHPQWVLTAAHCVVGDDDVVATPDRLTVRLGSPRLYAGRSHAVDVVELSPDWNPRRLVSDAALLHLAEPATEAPVTLGTAADAPAGATARVIGWGQTSTRGGASSNLREADVPVVDDGVCGDRDVYWRAFDARTMLCAGGAGADACYGDSGGPLLVDADPSDLVDWRQVGVVSWGGEQGCGAQGYPGVYAELANPRVRAWIDGTLSGTPFVLPDLDAEPAPEPPSAPAEPVVVSPVTAVPIDETPAATPVLAAVDLPSSCPRARCRIALVFPSAGRASVRVALPGARGRRSGARRAVTLARRRVTAPAAGRRVVTVRLPAKVRRAMRRARVRRLPVRLSADVSVTGTSVVRASRTAVVRR